MIRITGLNSWTALGLQAAPSTKFASVRRLSMLRRNIALAACGANSQMSVRGLGGTSQLAALLARRALEIRRFSVWHGSCLEGSTKFCQGVQENVSAREP